MRLTKDAIERAPAPADGREERFIRDEVVRGLGVRIAMSGAKSWIFEARIKGRPRRFSLGRWPDLNVVHARQQAMEIRTAMGRGEDPFTGPTPNKSTSCRSVISPSATWPSTLEFTSASVAGVRTSACW